MSKQPPETPDRDDWYVTDSGMPDLSQEELREMPFRPDAGAPGEGGRDMIRYTAIIGETEQETDSEHAVEIATLIFKDRDRAMQHIIELECQVTDDEEPVYFGIRGVLIRLEHCPDPEGDE